MQDIAVLYNNNNGYSYVLFLQIGHNPFIKKTHNIKSTVHDAN